MKTERMVRNFSKRRALIATSEGCGAEALPRTLERLGISPVLLPTRDNVLCSLTCLDICPERDVLFLDGDLALPADWNEEGKEQKTTLPPAPLVGLVGIEAPSRLRALIVLGATAFLNKPVRAGATYSSLYLAVNEFNRRNETRSSLEAMSAKRQKRGFVIKAVIQTMCHLSVDEDAAFSVLRKEAMKNRQTIEDYCEFFVATKKNLTAIIAQEQGTRRATSERIAAFS